MRALPRRRLSRHTTSVASSTAWRAMRSRQPARRWGQCAVAGRRRNTARQMYWRTCRSRAGSRVTTTRALPREMTLPTRLGTTASRTCDRQRSARSTTGSIAPVAWPNAIHPAPHTGGSTRYGLRIRRCRQSRRRLASVPNSPTHFFPVPRTPFCRPGDLDRL